MFIRRTTAAVVISLAFPFAASAADLPERLQGTWRTTGLDDHEAEVERAVQEMSIIKRPFARSKLKKAVRPCRRIRIWETAQGRVGIQCDGRPAAVATPGRTVTYTAETGDMYDLRYELRGDSIVQYFSDEDGTRANTYRVTDGRLRVHTRISGDQLPTALTYNETFVA